MPAQLIKLNIRNFQRISAAEIDWPQSQDVIVTGRNRQGKSSFLAAIGVLLGGTSLASSTPIKAGASEAVISGTVQLDSGETVTITRKVTDKGSWTVQIAGEAGHKIQRPAEWLTSILGKAGARAFNPMQLSEMSAELRIKTIMGWFGIDFAELDAELKEFYDERTKINHKVDELKVKLATAQLIPDIPEEEVDVSSLQAKLNAALENNSKVQNAAATITSKTNLVNATKAQIEALEKQLATLKEQLVAQTVEVQKATEALAGLQEVDTTGIVSQITDITETNRKVRANAEYRKMLEELEQQKAASDARTTVIEEIREEREKKINEAPWPIPGMGFDDGDITYNGLPFASLSDSEQIFVSGSLAISQLGEVKMVINERADLYDKEHRELIRKIANDAGAQIIFELVESYDTPNTIVIDDGEIASINTEVSA